MSGGESLAVPLRALALTTVARDYEDAIGRAEAENWGNRLLLSYLVENELNERLRRKIERQIKESGLPPGKTLDTIEEKKLPDKVRRQLATLLSEELVRRARYAHAPARDDHQGRSASASAYGKRRLGLSITHIFDAE